ncbi:hypothetical protein KTN05_14835 [Paracoccus sp. Z118]|uniref:hypothetical protein n=1 Tax=Paracoccus sp. Z118 TaxID=2851017 RepID=UPI001C2C9A52|nr:hypothetical protein [Paracoccus sp. Z118]MBV0893096.1 hypothetical protein [Paracoccus sp. Z118]
MSEACEILHRWANTLPRLNASYAAGEVPKNGIYLVFESGELAHGGNRIVRVGTHTGKDNLPKRLHEHLFKPNKDRSIFRKHIGRCLLADDPFLAQWNFDLTSRANKVKFADRVDMLRQHDVEARVSQYITDNLEFVVFPVKEKHERLELEKSLLATIKCCADCKPSPNWLGLKHQAEIIREGLWNIQGFGGQPLNVSTVQALAFHTEARES